MSKVIVRLYNDLQCRFQYASFEGCKWGRECFFSHEIHECPFGDECKFGDKCYFVHSDEELIPCVYPGCDRVSCPSRGPYCRLCHFYLNKTDELRKCGNHDCNNYSAFPYCPSCYSKHRGIKDHEANAEDHADDHADDHDDHEDNEDNEDNEEDHEEDNEDNEEDHEDNEEDHEEDNEDNEANLPTPPTEVKLQLPQLPPPTSILPNGLKITAPPTTPTVLPITITINCKFVMHYNAKDGTCSWTCEPSPSPSS